MATSLLAFVKWTSQPATRREAVNSYRLLADGEDIDLDGADGNVKMIIKHLGNGAADGRWRQRL